MGLRTVGLSSCVCAVLAVSTGQGACVAGMVQSKCVTDTQQFVEMCAQGRVAGLAHPHWHAPPLCKTYE